MTQRAQEQRIHNHIERCLCPHHREEQRRCIPEKASREEQDLWRISQGEEGECRGRQEQRSFGNSHCEAISFPGNTTQRGKGMGCIKERKRKEKATWPDSSRLDFKT